MHEASALVAGATVRRRRGGLARRGRAARSTSPAACTTRCRPGRAGFCVYNDPAIAIARLLDLGAERVAYVDVDVHHGDGVQAIFYDDPRVLTISLHETPLALFPGTGFPRRDRRAGRRGQRGQRGAAARAPTTPAGCARSTRSCRRRCARSGRRCCSPSAAPTRYRLDPLADLRLTVDGQRATYLAMRALADELCDGRWVATGGGGYALVEVVPRAWTHLLAIATGEPLDPATPTPPAWRELAARARAARPGRVPRPDRR